MRPQVGRAGCVPARLGHVADLACWAYAGGMNPDS